MGNNEWGLINFALYMKDVNNVPASRYIDSEYKEASKRSMIHTTHCECFKCQKDSRIEIPEHINEYLEKIYDNRN